MTLFCYSLLPPNIPTAHLPHYIYTLLPPRDNRDVGAQIYREHEISQGSHNNDPARHETALVFLSVINFVTSDGITKEGRVSAISVATSQQTSECFIFQHNNIKRAARWNKRENETVCISLRSANSESRDSDCSLSICNS